MRKLRGPEIGLVFQEPMTRLDPLMRISDHFAEALRTHEPDISDAEVRRRSLEALGGVGIPPTRFRNYPYEFSGGMRQRIMIALALVFRPRFVVADEPTTALDVLVEAQILSIIADLKNNFDTSLLLITHNLGIVAESCDRVAVMYAGRIVEQGAVADIFSRPGAPLHPGAHALDDLAVDPRSSTSSRVRRPTSSSRLRVAGSTHAARTRCEVCAGAASRSVTEVTAGPPRRVLAPRSRATRSRRRPAPARTRGDRHCRRSLTSETHPLFSTCAT